MSEAPYLIGLTGNIATGKSVVAQMLAELGAQVVDADQVGHEVMQPGGPAYDGVVAAFGREILTPEGWIDRARLGSVVFRDPAALNRLEAAVHPAVIAEVDRCIAEATRPVVVVEAIKLIEAGMHRLYDAMWVVTAPRHVQIARLMAARGLSEEQAELRVDAQPPQAQKAALADVIISNDGNLAELRQKVEMAWDRTLPHLRGRRSRPDEPPRRIIEGDLIIRPVQRDDLADAAGVADVLNSVIKERGRTVLTGDWTPADERAFLQSLGPRSEVIVAELDGRIVGFQVIEPFVTYTSTMDHVAHVGTYVLPSYRCGGIGWRLAVETLAFARAQGYQKSVVFVLADNEAGLAYYRRLGFVPIGTLSRQARIEGDYRDQVVLELHFHGS